MASIRPGNSDLAECAGISEFLLRLNHSQVEFPCGHEPAVRSRFCDASRLHHDQAVGPVQGGQAMGDGDHSPASREVRQGHVNAFLSFQIQGSCRLVQDQDARIMQDGARNGDALVFASRESLSLFSYLGFISIRKIHDEVVSLAETGRLHHLGMLGIGFGVANVLRDGAREQERILGHNNNLTAHGCWFPGAEIDTINGDPAVAVASSWPVGSRLAKETLTCP